MSQSSDLLEEILEHGPSQSTVLLVLTKMRQDGHYSRVIQGCLSALQTYPDEIRFRTLLVECYLRLGFFTQAEIELEHAIAQIRTLIPVYRLQGELYFRQKRFQEAEDALKRFLVFDPADKTAQELLQRIEQIKEQGTEVRIREDEPQESQVYEQEGAEMTLQGEGALDQASATLAEIYYKQGQIQDAVRVYEKVLEENPADEIARRRLSEIQAEISGEGPILAPKIPEIDAKKEGLISVLEGWLARIQGSNRLR